MIKKIFGSKTKLLSFFLVVFLLAVLAKLTFARELEIQYPQLPGMPFPTEAKNLLPNYVKYIFTFVVGIAGIIAFGSIIYGGALYVGSGASPSALNDAKSRIFSGIIGLVILLASYLILITINPQLIIIGPPIKANWGIVVYKNADCSGENKEVTKDTPALGDFDDKIQSLKFVADPGTLDIQFFPDYNYLGTPKSVSSEKTDAKICLKFSDLGFNNATKSVKFFWKLAGVSLFNATGEEKVFASDTLRISGDFDNKATKIKFNNLGSTDFGAILFEDPNLGGKCKIYASAGSYNSGLTWITPVPKFTAVDISNFGNGVSSIKVFNPLTEASNSGDGVTFYTDDNFGGSPSSTFQNSQGFIYLNDSRAPQTTSLKINGNYLAILFERENVDGLCQVFTKSDANLRDDPIGRCGCSVFGINCGDCATAYIVLPLK